MNEDYKEMLQLLLEEGVEFLVIGAYAMGVYGTPRATGDIDIWLNPTKENSKKSYLVLKKFGSPLKGLNDTTFSQKNIVFQIGLAPRRIDLITSIDGVDFSEAYIEKKIINVDELVIPIISKAHLIQNKKASNRLKDKADLELLTKEE